MNSNETVGVHGELQHIWAECQSLDWDGYGAAPISPETLRRSQAVVDSLPPYVPAPSIGAEPDGHVTLEWHHSQQRTLSVSVSPEGMLYYAGLFGSERRFGSVMLEGEFPIVIANLVQEIGLE